MCLNVACLDFDLKGHFWVFLFYLFDLLLFLFSDCRSYAVCGNCFRLRMAHFSVPCDSIASLFIFVRIGFEPCNNHLQLLYCRARLFAIVARCCVTYHGYLSLDPFFSIVAQFFKSCTMR